MDSLTTAPISWDRVAYLNRWVSRGLPAPQSEAARLPVCLVGRRQTGQAGGCGAVVTFIGVVRADQDGRHIVRALFYDAYPEMAEPLLQRLVNEARAQWTLEGVHIQHRLGLVEVGQISVVIVVAAQHRTQAHAASQFLLEQIKHTAPIWKREQYEDGTSQWIIGAPELLDVADPQGAEHAHSTSLRAMVSERSESSHAHV